MGILPVIDRIGGEAWRDVQQCAWGRGYLHAADGSSFWTLADGVVGQMSRCTNTGRFLAALRHGRSGMLPPDTVKHAGQPPAAGRGPAAGGAVRGGRSVKRSPHSQLIFHFRGRTKI